MFVRVRDRDTKHEFDVPEGDKRIGVSMDLIKGDRFPPVLRPRRPKHHIKLAGRPASREPVAPIEAPEEAADKENRDD
jgi:hypothetical protein